MENTIDFFADFSVFFKEKYQEEYEKILHNIPVNWIENEASMTSLLKDAIFMFFSEKEIEFNKESLTIILLLAQTFYLELDNARRKFPE
jgi:hypothetical protein